MPFYQQLIAETAREREYLLTAPIFLACRQGRIERQQYLAFLTQAYHHVKHTVPLLMSCGARLGERQRALLEAVTEYIEEEKGHEQWILSDIREAGGDARAAQAAPPHLSTELMVAYVYDAINRRNPLSLFGMVLVLEGTSVNLATGMADLVRERLALPESAFSYLYSHGELDQQHLEFFEKLMDTLTEPEDQQAVVDTARVVYRLYGQMFRSLTGEESV